MDVLGNVGGREASARSTTNRACWQDPDVTLVVGPLDDPGLPVGNPQRVVVATGHDQVARPDREAIRPYGGGDVGDITAGDARMADRGICLSGLIIGRDGDGITGSRDVCQRRMHRFRRLVEPHEAELLQAIEELLGTLAVA